MTKKKQESTTVRFRVEGDETAYEIDPLGLTIGEMSAIEVQFNLPYDTVLEQWGDSQRFSQVLIAMAIQREKPNFKTSDAGELRPEQIEFIDDVPPTKASSPSGTKKSARSSE